MYFQCENCGGDVFVVSHVSSYKTRMDEKGTELETFSPSGRTIISCEDCGEEVSNEEVD